MDTNEAKFILSNFRPDGADANSPDFAEALALAASNRELGEWLAVERSKDAEFAGALSRLSLPEHLREEILSGLAAERGQFPERDEQDATLAGALAAVMPPAGLRDEILMAMKRSQPVASGKGRGWWRFGLPLAAAAGIALAFLVNGPQGSQPEDLAKLDNLPGGAAVPITYVEDAAISELTAPGFTLDLKNEDHQALFEFIRESGRACPAGCLPKGLENEEGIGCRKLEIQGKPGAIVCFRKGEDGAVHLVVFRDEDVKDCGAERCEPDFAQRGDWAVARWHEKGRVFLLLGKMEKEQLGELF